MINDLRYALRVMRRSPLFAVTVVLTVALAIAANTAIFSVVNAVMLRPLPYRQPERLVQVAEKNDTLSLPTFSVSLLNYLSWREQSPKSFEEIAAIGFETYTLTGSGEPEQITGNRISPGLMPMLGLAPVAGRVFTGDEEKPGAAPVAMLGEGLWRRRFGADPGVVGRALTLNGVPRTVVGIAPAALNLLSGGDLCTPLTIDPANENRLNHTLLVAGRLRPGVPLRQAQAEMDGVAARVGAEHPENREWGIHLLSFFDTFVSAQLRTGLLMLLAAVGCVLLIACANIANLLLARAAARQQEIATRTALGAGRGRLVRQLLIESVVLSLAGGIVGLLGAFWAVRAIQGALPPNTLPTPDIPVDLSVLLFALGLTVVTGLLFGIVPAWRMTKTDLNDALKQAGRGESGRLRAGMRNGLVGAEIALATILLIGAGLLIKSLGRLEAVKPGFDSRGLMTFQLAPPLTRYPLQAGQTTELHRRLLETLRAVPGVGGAVASSGLPFGAGNYYQSPFMTNDSTVVSPETSMPIEWRLVSPGYFGGMGIPLLRGREFTDADGPEAPLVVIASQSAAKRLWGEADPLGRTVHRPMQALQFTVVGVAGDIHSTALNQDAPTLYFPLPWRSPPLVDLAVRTTGDPEALLPTIRRKVHEIDAELALANVRTIDQWIANSAAQPRLNAVLLGIFAATALLIAAIGIYGVLAYTVTQRTREIGLRMALGATPRGVMRLVVGQGMTVALLGLGLGLVGGLALAHSVSSLVFGVTVRDPATYAAVAFVLGSVALGACALPARRAARVDPMVALRCE
ncbi:MAG TPA: ABC transporter permease [Candidatus Polarisedimenticolia bacterium]|nr:ABC transporter permease [Candidatus Polarisedimenticolia bacterium]